MNSEQPSILSGYNLWELMAKEVRRPGEKEEAQTITEILKQPDNTEEVNMGRALTSLSKGLDNTLGQVFRGFAVVIVQKQSYLDLMNVSLVLVMACQ